MAVAEWRSQRAVNATASRCGLWIVVCCLCTGAIQPAVAAEEAEPLVGSGASYWGTIPPAADSLRGRFTDPPLPLWEAFFYWPYQAVALPFRLLGFVVVGSVVVFDELSVYNRVRDALELNFLPIETRLSFTAGGSDGLGIGLTSYDRDFFGTTNRLKIGLQYTTNEAAKAHAGLELFEGARDSFEFGAGYENKPDARFFGIGPEASASDRSFFTREVGWGGATYRRRVVSGLSIEAAALVTSVGTRGPREDEGPALEARFGPSERPTGYATRSDGVEFGVALRHDTTSEPGRPERGGLRQVRIGYFSATNDADVRYWSYRVELQQYFPLWLTKRTLATRAVLGRLDNAGGAEMPFQRLLTNDTPDQLRGYDDLRWRDRGYLAFSAEYRWPFWNWETIEGIGLDAYAFVDYGQVFGDPNQIALTNATASYGGGLRLVSATRFYGRLEIAHSSEDTVVRLRGDQLFQFAKGGLYYGRNPVPTR